MAFVGGYPPGPHAGDISPLTEALRPPVRMPPAQCKAARRLRRCDWKAEDIAVEFNAPINEVDKALATLRTPNPGATRANLNVTTAAHEFVVREGDAGESVWSVVDRMFIELMYWRARGGVPLVRGEANPV